MAKPEAASPDMRAPASIRASGPSFLDPLRTGGAADSNGQSIDGDLVRALQNVNRKLRRRLYDLNSLFKISVELAAIREERTLLSAYLLNVMGLLAVEVGAVLLDTPGEGCGLEPVLTRGISNETARHLARLLAQDGENALSSSHPVRLARNGGARPTGLFEQIACAVGVEVAMPLHHRDDRLGVVLLGKGDQRVSISNAELEMLGLLSNLVATALTNVRMYQRLEQISQTDGLTGLYNRRHFQTLLRNEVSRAQRFGRRVSLALLDVDHFKNYNDTLGHLAGDELLRILSRVLQESVRCTDFVARYGGEEFCVILPEVDREGARSFCERLRNRIAEHPFPQRACQPGGRVTVSIGCSTYPDDACSPEELLANADKAVYEAKGLGRNRSVQFTHSDDVVALL
jgi:diguanylate cyclase (GGDEF)-like protein